MALGRQCWQHPAAWQVPGDAGEQLTGSHCNGKADLCFVQ